MTKNKSRFKDFGTGSVANVEPISFKLHGEEFECVPQVPGKLLLDLVAAEGENSNANAAHMVTEFFSRVLVDESWKRFDALLNDKNRIVNVSTLADITTWLIEEYTNRPEEQPEA
jgi:hypothetical protein